MKLPKEMTTWVTGKGVGDDKKKGSFTQEKKSLKAKPAQLCGWQETFTVLCPSPALHLCTHMETSLVTCSANMNRTYSQPCLLRSGPLGDKDLPTNKEGKPHQLLTNPVLHYVQEWSTKYPESSLPVFLYTKKIIPGGMPWKKKKRGIQKENDVRLKKQQ